MAGVRYHGDLVTAFAARRDGELHVYATRDFQADGPKTVLPDDVTDRVQADHAALHPVALRGEGRLVVALGTCHSEAVVSPVDLSEVLDRTRRYTLRQYSSEKSAWGEPEYATGGEFARPGVRLEGQGYHVMEFEWDEHQEG
jgi:hypothetical protein